MGNLDAIWTPPRRALRQAFRARRTSTANDNAGGGAGANALPDMGLVARAGAPGLAIRHALETLAHDPALRSPGPVLARLRPLVAAERAALAQARTPGRMSYGVGHARLIDAVACGLLDLARAYVGWGGWSDAAPLAAVAAREYAKASLAPGTAPELLFVVPESGGHERRNGERMAAFAMIGFADLGLDMRCTARSASEYGALARKYKVTDCVRRFVWGRYDLYAALAEAIPAPAPQAGVDAAGATV